MIALGERVLTLTNRSAVSDEFGDRIETAPLRFDNHLALTDSLRGASTLYNTYWVRFDKGARTHEAAVRNTLALLRAAEAAKVQRIVHISITNPSADSPLPYFRGKAVLEEAVRRSGLRHSILRPAVIFGKEDILMNNIAFFLRKFPIFVIPGSGDYRLQPIYVEDLAQLAVEAGQASGDEGIDAVGPEIFSFEELVRTIASEIKSRARIVHLPATLALGCIQGLGLCLGDVVLTRDELTGLMADLLVSTQPARGRTRFSDWLRENSATIGKHYASEIRRHYREPDSGLRPRRVSLA